jgi:prolyl oligopeptidase
MMYAGESCGFRVLRSALMCVAALLPLSAIAQQAAVAEDPYLWLEEVTGDKALAWAREKNAASQAELQSHAAYAPVRARMLDILNAKDRIPYVSRIGGYFYNLWQDEMQKRGVWRRTTLEEYRKPNPKWETVLDIDALGKAENENWVWAGSSCLAPQYTRCMIGLSRGGADARVMREFDLSTKQFVKDGFNLPEAKTQVDWLDADTLYVGTDFGPGSMTKSGYARLVKEWKRGTPLAQAKTVWEGKESDVSAWATVTKSRGYERTFFGRSPDFFTNEMFVVQDGKPVRIDKPMDAVFSAVRQWATISLRSDWSVGGTTYKRGSYLIMPFDAFMKGERNFTVLFEPTDSTALSGVSFTRSHVLVNVLDNVSSRLVEWRHVDGQWTSRNVKPLSATSAGTISAAALHDSSLADDPYGDWYGINYNDFLTPDSFMLARAGSDERELIKQRPAQFNAEGMKSEQLFAISKDGTRVPYFVIYPKDYKAGIPLATLLYGYGGFNVSQRPVYSAAWGSAWLERGGVMVVSNIRGGGEFGPRWHQAALKQNRQKSFDDFIAIAEDLIKRNITTPRQLGILGGSNGGLLVGAVAVQRPELFGAVVCAVPLLDMQRYHKLLAGNSWMAEYGNPDKPEEWAYISQYSPYHNLKGDAKYPRIFFTTSTRDDRVHPGHARKMAARMLEMGHPVLYYENIEGGHGGAADNSQRAHLQALQYAYLWQQLGKR